MKNLWTSVIPVLSLLAGTAMAANVCEPKALDFKGLEDRSVEIAFPDGKRVIIVGEIHGDRSVTQLAGLATDASQSKEQFLRNVAILTSQQADAIAHARVNLTFLASLRTHYVDVKLVGIEAPPETAEKLKTLYPKVLGVLESRAQSLGVAIESVQEIALPAFGTQLYLLTKVPAAFLGIEVAGIESASAIGGERAAVSKEMGAADAKFRVASGNRVELIQKQNEMIDFLLSMYGAEDRRSPEARAKIRAKLELDFPKELHPAMEEVISAELTVGDHRDRRDEHVATTLASRKTSSVFVVGRDHLKALTAKLTRKCLGR